MQPTLLLASAAALLSSVSLAAVLPTGLQTRQYQDTRSGSFSKPFDILIRPVNVGGRDFYRDPLYLSELNTNNAHCMHNPTASQAPFKLRNGVLSTTMSSTSGQSAPWSNVQPAQGQLLSFAPSKASASAADVQLDAVQKHVPEIRIGAPGTALVLLSIDDDVYAFYFCQSKDGKTQYGLSFGKHRGKDVKCVNVYLEAVPANNQA